MSEFVSLWVCEFCIYWDADASKNVSQFPPIIFYSLSNHFWNYNLFWYVHTCGTDWRYYWFKAVEFLQFSFIGMSIIAEMYNNCQNDGK